MAHDFDQLVHALRAAAEPTRLRILAVCSRGELTVGEITRILGQSQPRVSRHLRLLCDAALLHRFREGHRVFYRVPVKGEGAELVGGLLECLDAADQRLERDMARTEEVRSERFGEDEDPAHRRPAPWPGSSGRADEGRIRWAVLNMLGDAPVGDLLDVGTGGGRILRLLGGRAEQAVGVDISSDVLDAVRTSLHQAGLHHCVLRQGSMYTLPFADAIFDTVTFDEVLGEADRPRDALAEALRVLRPGGRLLVVDVTRGNNPAGDLASDLQAVGADRLRVSKLQLGQGSVFVLLARRPEKSGLAA